MLTTCSSVEAYGNRHDGIEVTVLLYVVVIRSTRVVKSILIQTVIYHNSCYSGRYIFLNSINDHWSVPNNPGRFDDNNIPSPLTVLLYVAVRSTRTDEY